jgi:hypothetical protein
MSRTLCEFCRYVWLQNTAYPYEHFKHPSLYVLLRRFRLVNDFRCHLVLLAVILNSVIDSNKPTCTGKGALCTPQRHVVRGVKE